MQLFQWGPVSVGSTVLESPAHPISKIELKRAPGSPEVNAWVPALRVSGRLFLVAYVIGANLGSRAVPDRFVACYVGRSQNWYLAVVRFAAFEGL
jgi:hypothetical protein